MVAELIVVFRRPDGQEEPKVFTTRPLGVEFVQKMPIVITKVEGEASDIGVKRGWRVMAVGETLLDGMGFVDAYLHFKQASLHLRQDFIVRDCPVNQAAVSALKEKLGPVDPVEVPEYLKRFGYFASSHNAWESGGEQPQLWMGVIDGHKEKGTPYTHTWYALHSRLASAGKPPYKWQVERRLAHLRACLHDPLRRELGRDYDRHFKNASFAHHAGPPGTTAKLEAWLSALAKVINGGKASPSLVAVTLRFFEAPDLTEATFCASRPVVPLQDGEQPAQEFDDECTDDGSATECGVTEVGDDGGWHPDVDGEGESAPDLAEAAVFASQLAVPSQAGEQPAQEFDDECTDDGGATKCGVTQAGDDEGWHPDVAGEVESPNAPSKRMSL